MRRRRPISRRWAYQNLVLPNWGVFGVFLTVAELAIGRGLIFGVATRLAAAGGLLLLAPIWLMRLHTGGYLWEYPAEDLFPVVLLAIVPAGRLAGFDRTLALRCGHRWPFWTPTRPNGRATSAMGRDVRG